MMLVVDVICDSYKNHFWPEIRLDDEITVSELKDKLYIKTGISPSYMNIFAYNAKNPENKLYLDDDNKNLKSYRIDTGFTIEVREYKSAHILDINENNGCVQKNPITIDYSSLANSNNKLYQHYVNQADKLGEEMGEEEFHRYEMSEEDYEKRNTGLREFINRMRSKAESKSRLSQHQNESKLKVNDVMEIKALYPLESRCCVSPGDRRGRIVYVGYIDKSNVKIGVHLDEPMGNCDGTYNNRSYFNCDANYGGFFDPTHVKVGDYPQLDPFEIVE